MEHNFFDKPRPIFPSSDKLTNPEPRKPKRDWPWKTLECGQSFSIEFEEIKLVTLRPMVSNMGRQLGKKFKLIVHDSCYEVGRVK